MAYYAAHNKKMYLCPINAFGLYGFYGRGFEPQEKIDDTICKENTVVMNLKHQENPYNPERDLEIKEFEKKFTDDVLDLEKEKRKEYVECWRDMMNIRRYLMAAFREYWDFARSRGLLGGDGVNSEKN